MPITGQSGAANKAGAGTGKLPSNKKNSSKTAASQSEIETNAAADIPTNTAGSKTSISGIPLGTQVRTGKEETKYVGSQLQSGVPVYNAVTYTTDSPYLIPATMSNAEKANLLVALGRIPGLYSKDKAPTTDFVKNMGQSVTLRPEDHVALGAMMKVADQVGETYSQTIMRFVSNPSLAEQAFGKVTATGNAVRTTNPAALGAEMTTKYLDLFNIAPDKATADAYATEVNQAEKNAAVRGFALTAQEKEDIFLKYVENTAKVRFAKAQATPGTEDDMALEQGALGAVVRQIRASHAENGIPTSDRMIYSEALNGIRSRQALENTLSTIQIQAATQFPAFKEQILKGVSVKTLLNPYVQSYEKIYGKTPQPMDLYDVASGQAAIPVLEWENAQWKKPGIKNTQFYKDTVKNDLRAMADAFGVNV